ncbi:MAG: TetR/AcrR family transcriptional regulator [Deltaproteobacteria bacterium]|nr:TetR/AcrR family transcriptional regulator [Deltaproteobacteria bacterium]
MKQKIDIDIIFQAALTVFARFGFKKTTVQDIADQLDMTKGNLYRYSKNKRDLYEKTVSWGLTRWQNNVRRAIAGESEVTDQFLVMCRSAVTYLSKDPDLRLVLAADPDIFPMFAGADPYASINRASVEMIKAILKRGIRQKRFRSVDVDATAETIFGIYKMLIIRGYIRNEKRQIEQMFEQALELMTHGLIAPMGQLKSPAPRTAVGLVKTTRKESKKL